MPALPVRRGPCSSVRARRIDPMPTTDTTLAELASTHPAAARVFLAHGLDFCCKGRRPLAAACSEKGLDASFVLTEIEQSGVSGDLADWGARPVNELIDHILTQ